MRLLITADLHYNHSRGRAAAEEVIARMNTAGGDVLILVGDTASFDGDALERCLERFRFDGPKLFVPGNHELWTRGPDSYMLWTTELPRRCRAMGWQWLSDDPLIAGDIAIVGSLGWYDYSFAATQLGIPLRFYEHKISPGVAMRFEQYSWLLGDESDIPAASREIFARWNDGIHVRLGRSDREFLAENLQKLQRQLDGLAHVRTVIAAIHCLPFAELLPPFHSNQWDFAKAYLGSVEIGRLLLRYPNVKRVFCGHSHFPAEAIVNHIHATNIGSGYRAKFFRSENVL